MAVDGVYGVVYGGPFALGAAVFRVTNGKVMGANHVGGRYIGTVTEDAAGNIDMNVIFKAGVILTPGTDAQEEPYSRTIKHKFPPMFGDGEPQKIGMPPGWVTVMIKRIPDEPYGALATRGFKLQVNPQMEAEESHS
jgi:hypothetical protein